MLIHFQHFVKFEILFSLGEWEAQPDYRFTNKHIGRYTYTILNAFRYEIRCNYLSVSNVRTYIMYVYDVIVCQQAVISRALRNPLIV